MSGGRDTSKVRMQEHDKQEPQADGTAVEDLSATLESLLDASQRSAEQLAQLLERSERAQSEIAERGAALERQLNRHTGIGDDAPGATAPVSPDAEQLEEARAMAEAADRPASAQTEQTDKPQGDDTGEDVPRE